VLTEANRASRLGRRCLGLSEASDGTFEIDIEIGRDAHEVFVVPAIAQPSPAGPRPAALRTTAPPERLDGDRASAACWVATTTVADEGAL
jgi:hypothetical protein